MSYKLHPSSVLQELFRAKPYQGARPEEAQFVFIGLDANYAPDLEYTESFADVLEYHEDGVAFWHQRGVHHPFLLRTYKGAGRRYHRYFAGLGFSQRHADRVSFTELLHLPTTDSSLKAADLDAAHLRRLNALINQGGPKHVFVCDQVAMLMRRRSDVFNRLSSTPRLGDAGLLEMHKVGATTVYEHVHFSAWGEWQDRKDREAAAIRTLAAAST